jgi:23S rRNA-/tRNA-specific pseudouridylate synthase
MNPTAKDSELQAAAAAAATNKKDEGVPTAAIVDASASARSPPAALPPYSADNESDHPVQVQHREHHHHQERNKKRGVKKTRPKRNKTRPRSETHAIDGEAAAVTVVRRIDDMLDNGTPTGTPVKKISSTGWLRTVEPYPHTFSTFAKARWVGRTVLDVYCTEFGSYPKSYYESVIAQGRILVSDQHVALTHVIKDGDVLSHTVHRHEPGVAVYSPDPPFVKIIQDTQDVVVVDKPGTLPVHPCGGYHVQSLMNLLEPQFGKLYTIHRLDRLTSGLIILGKTSTVAKEWGKNIMNRNCQKAYLARVAGKFPLNCPADLELELDCTTTSTSTSTTTTILPDHGEWPAATPKEENESSEEPVVVAARKRNAHGYWITDGSNGISNGTVQTNVNLRQVFDSQHSEDAWLQKAEDNDDHYTNTNMHWFHLACPTRIAKPKDGVCEAGTFDELEDALYLKTVKPAETSFGVVRYDAATDSTVVVCRPTTGRTHQIRLHLQYLGHAIANDPNYGGDIWYGNPEGKQGCQRAQKRLDAINAANQDEMDRLTQGTKGGPSTAAIDVPATDQEIQESVSSAVREETESIHDFIKRTCVWCARSRNTNIGGGGSDDRTALEFLIRSPGIWLHALQYSFVGLVDGGPSTSYRAPLPFWYTFDRDDTETSS